jgi:AraC-like DNA-binding protein
MARIIAALELLSSADATITEVALHVGYQSMSSFSRTFKDYVGKSPSVFRNEMNSS